MSYATGDAELIETIVQHLKSQGIFDAFRSDCLADVDTKPSFQNLRQRVEGYVSKFLSQQKWNQTLNKNQLRERLRRQINESGMLKYGIEHLVDQVVNPKINSLFLPKIESVVKEFLGICDEPTVPVKWENDYDANSQNLHVNSQNGTSHLDNDKYANHVKTESEEPQPMDIESDSESSPINHNNDNIRINDNTNDASQQLANESEYMTSPSPPQPEMLTPQRTDDSPQSIVTETNILEPLEENIIIKSENVECDQQIPQIEVKMEEQIEECNDDTNNDTTNNDEIIQLKEIPKEPAESKETPKEYSKSSAPLKETDKKEYSKCSAPLKETDKNEPKPSASKGNSKIVSSLKDTVKMENKSETKDDTNEDHYLSDVSSVHTSDLSDFDDEISLSSGEEMEESKKKKISLKVVKEMTEVLRNKKSNDELIVIEDHKEKNLNIKIEKTVPIEEVKTDSNASKRKRKINPKYVSEDYSSIFTDKKIFRSCSGREEYEEESENSNISLSSVGKVKIKIEESDVKTIESRVSRRKKYSNITTEIEINKESDDSNQYNKPSKVRRKKSDDCTVEMTVRSSSRASVESKESKSSTMSESTQESVTNQSTKRKTSKTRIDTQSQKRYTESDLYKPRPVITSSRRSRGPTTPEEHTNTESSVHFVIHDLSK